MIRQETLYTEQQKRSGLIFQQSDLVEEFSEEVLENLLSELSDEDLENVAGGALSYVVTTRFSYYYSRPVPLYGTPPPDPMPLYGVWTRMPALGPFLT